jgi:hypothetical protein
MVSVVQNGTIKKLGYCLAIAAESTLLVNKIDKAFADYLISDVLKMGISLPL